MSNPNIAPLDESCRDCAFMSRDRDGGRWCSSPQALKGLGYSIRCVWERDDVRDNERSHPAGTGKCGSRALNFKRREMV